MPEQILYMDETSRFWKGMSERTFIHKEAESSARFQGFKDRITVSLGGRVAGYKLKPFCNLAQWEPRGLRAYQTHWQCSAGVIRSRGWPRSSSWMPSLSCYTSEMEYCMGNNIPFKMLLVVDNASRHPSFIGDLHPNIEVMLLPPNTTSWIQPMNQAIFKVCCLRTFSQAIAAAEEDTEYYSGRFAVSITA